MFSCSTPRYIPIPADSHQSQLLQEPLRSSPLQERRSAANPAQFFNAIKEAEAYDGPSLIIAYSPCINHGLKAGMGLSQKEEKLAVECGYWHLYRYNPALEEEGKNPFSLDSKEPDWTKFQSFLKGEVRFASLYKMFPETADELLQKTEEFAKIRLNTYKRLAGKE